MTLKIWHCSDPPFKDISSALETSYFKQIVHLHQIPIQPVFTILTLNIDTNNVQIKICESRILFGQAWQGALSPRRTIEGRTVHRVPSKPGQGQNWFQELEKKVTLPKIARIWLLFRLNDHHH